jgi:hypothetical protein
MHGGPNVGQAYLDLLGGLASQETSRIDRTTNDRILVGKQPCLPTARSD